MFELFKLIWDAIVLRDAARKGQLSVRMFLYGIGFAVLLYATALPATLLYQKHPQYKPVLVAALVFDALLVVGFLVWAWRWRSAQSAARKATTSPPPRTR